MHLFRHEAVNFRLFRHLGEVFLYSSISARIITFVPIAILALLFFGLTKLTYRNQFDGLFRYLGENQRATLLLNRGADTQFEIDHTYQIGFTPQGHRQEFLVIAKRFTNCEDSSSSNQFDGQCIDLTIQFEEASALQNHNGSIGVLVWSAPVTFPDTLEGFGWGH